VDYIDLYATLTHVPAIWAEYERDVQAASIIRISPESAASPAATLPSISDIYSAPLAGRAPLSFLRAPLSFVSSEWSVAYLIALAIFGCGILVGAFTYVSRPAWIAQSPKGAFRDNGVPTVDAERVGQITGMIDCRWPDARTSLTTTDVYLGNRYVLASGLMEITYNSGARAILRGPTTYTVNSPNGGFLAMGKVSVRVNKKAEDGDSSKSGFHLPPPELFSVRTPTAVVTDLGTEFGVDVDPQGIADVHVFSGKVKAIVLASDTDPSSESLLTEGEAMRLEPHRPLIRRAANRTAFSVELRRLGSAAVAHWTTSAEQSGLIANWKFNEGAGARVSESIRGIRQRVTGPADWISGKCGMALSFRDAPDKPAWIDTSYNLVGDDAEFPKHFTISVWVDLPRVLDDYGTIVEQQYFGDGSQNLWPHGFYTAIERDNRAHFGVCVADRWINMNSAMQLSVHQWHHLGFVYDSKQTAGNLRIYVDGQRDAHELTTAGEPLTLPVGDARVRIGRHVKHKCNFTAGMDDLSFWTRALNDAELRAICNLANDKTLNYDSQQASELFQIYAQGEGHHGAVGEQRWTAIKNLIGHRAGDLWTSENKYFLQLDDVGNGLIAEEVGENEEKRP
jgi:hypothetical protein